MNRTTLTVFGVLGALGCSCNADILWEWSFGSEEGTFKTTGVFAQTGAAGTFAFVEGSFTVTASAGGVVQSADPTTLVYFGVGGAASAYVPGDMNWTGSAVGSFNVPGSSFPDLWQGNSSHTGPGRPYIYQLHPINGGTLLEWRGSGSGFVQIASGPLTVTPVEPAGCYADCDGNETLDVFDFLCFQDAFVAMDPYANCDGNTTLDVFDFLCFQDAFVTGCP
jgi:hypothetical protein